MDFLVNHPLHVKIHIMDEKMNVTKYDWRQNPSYRKHKKQRFWQIFFPIGLGIAMILTLVAWIILTAVGSSGAGEISTWADTSLIWLILPALLFAFIAAMFLFVLIYFVRWMTKVLPPYSAILQHHSRQIAKKTRTLSDKLVAPMITTQSVKARVLAFFSALSGRSKK
jgi:hypothetical protein